MPNNSKTDEKKDFRRVLRKHMTAAEVALWQMLRRKNLKGYRFLRQYSIGPYVVDFYCHAARLVVELDGEVHNDPDQIAYDNRRTAFLNAQGLRVLRFENFEVFDYPERTLREIEKFLED